MADSENNFLNEYKTIDNNLCEVIKKEYELCEMLLVIKKLYEVLK